MARRKPWPPTAPCKPNIWVYDPSLMNLVAITLLRTDVPADVFDRMADILTESERTRAQRYRQEADRRRHIIGRAALRILLSERLGGTPQGIALTSRPHDKPCLAEPPAIPTHFNVSHAGERVAIAVASVPVGIDIERDAPPDAAAMAQAWFTPTERMRVDEAATDADSAGQAFLDIWTAKEAVLKASGVGMAAGMRGFTVPPASPRFGPTRTHGDTRFDGYVVAHFEALTDYRAAVALYGAARPLRITLANADTLLADAAARSVRH